MKEEEPTCFKLKMYCLACVQAMCVSACVRERVRVRVVVVLYKIFARSFKRNSSETIRRRRRWCRTFLGCSLVSAAGTDTLTRTFPVLGIPEGRRRQFQININTALFIPSTQCSDGVMLLMLSGGRWNGGGGDKRQRQEQHKASTSRQPHWNGRFNHPPSGFGRSPMQSKLLVVNYFLEN